ncbi:MAG: hypothetical protein HZA50_15055 [Planctomycetes bacterium]|nr:hypothetical protein [Planctomycetota bacterium]
MTDAEKPKNLLFPKPCRKKVDRKWVKQALSAFVGACGTVATATVVSIAVSQSSLKADPVQPPGGIQAQAVQLKGNAGPPVRISTTQPASRPETQPATQAATQPGQLTPQQQADAEKLIEKLDADQVVTRDAATRQLKEMGSPVVAFLKDVSASRKLSSEAFARVQAVIESFNPPAPPVEVRMRTESPLGGRPANRIQPPAEPGLKFCQGQGFCVVASQPASKPATQPASQPAQLMPQQKVDAEKLVEKLDSDKIAVRETATKQLKEMGQPVVAFLKDVSTSRKLSSEAAVRVQAIIDSFNPPVKVEPDVTNVFMEKTKGQMPAQRIQPPQPVE